MAGLRSFNLFLRFLMEAGIIVAMGVWGYRTGSHIGTKALLSIGAPVVVFGFWGLVDFRQAGKRAEYYRLSQELAISGLAAIVWYTSGSPIWGILLIIVSIVHHILVYLSGDRLLKQGS